MDRKLGVGILGTGWVSTEHIKAFEKNPHTRVVAICSRDRARAEAKRRALNVLHARAYDDYEQMLQQDDLDIVVICTPHEQHVEQGVAAAEAGKHIVMEKPVAITLPSLRQLDKAVRKNRVKTVVSFVLRWNPMFEWIKSVLAQRLLGNLFYIEADYIHGIGPEAPTYRWLHLRKHAGTAVLAGGCHAVDAVRWFMQKKAVEVQGYTCTSKTNPLRYDYPTTSVTLIKFADGSLGKVTTCFEARCPYTFPVTILGDEGSIRDNRIATKKWKGQLDWATVPTIRPESGDVTHHPFQGEADHFVDCILKDRESHCNIADAVQTHEICLATEISAREHCPVKLPLR
ncbi:MAG: Gfo/Idh/MocA family oxidoreductase [Verrucomicrobiae bacterium]|nr:Gfo/Idh/MocA family oxidoreductase [Verrucomicrobiae bacterium]